MTSALVQLVKICNGFHSTLDSDADDVQFSQYYIFVQKCQITLSSEFKVCPEKLGDLRGCIGEGACGQAGTVSITF